MTTGAFTGFGAPPAANANPFGAPVAAAPQGFAPAPLGPGMAGPGPGPSMMTPVGAGFILNIAPDPTWEPMETADTLEQDGYYAAKVTKENMRKEGDGVFFTLSLLDEDVLGKTLSKLMLDPNRQKSDIWFTWRNLIRSITGDLNAARQGLQYQVGMFTGHTVYFKTAPYADKNGGQKTGVDSWVTKPEWEEAVRSGRHRWASKLAGPVGGGLGALPSGLPTGFPAAPGGGMPPFPGAPAAAPAFPGTTPQPAGSPIQPAAAVAPAPIAAPVMAPPPQPAAVAAPAFAPPPSPPTFSFGNGAVTPQPPATAAGIAAAFPGAR